jgi:hypothetical protein
MGPVVSQFLQGYARIWLLIAGTKLRRLWLEYSWDLLVAGPIGLADLYCQPRLWPRLALTALILRAPVAAYNGIVFESPFGGMKGEVGMFALAHISRGLPGSPLSPARGLFIYFPAALLALLLVAWRADALLRNPLFLALATGIVLTIALIAFPVRWYGGWCFGPRYFTEIQGPILILLGAALESFGRRLGIITACLFLILLYSIFIHFMGTVNARAVEETLRNAFAIIIKSNNLTRIVDAPSAADRRLMQEVARERQ